MKKILSISLLIAACVLANAQSADPGVVFSCADPSAQQSFCIDVPVPDGNYLVSVRLGSKRRAGHTFIKAESRRLFVNGVETRRGEFKTVSFVVNKRDDVIRTPEGERKVSLKSRENGKLDWDGCLNLEILGDAPVVCEIKVEPANATTVFLCGDSTVVDQDNEPWASWGQMFPWFFDTQVAVANYGESGERTDTFLAAGRLDKILTQLKPGDYVFVEFGHNDQKINSRPGGGAYYYFATNLKTFIDLIREAGGIPVLVTPTHRRNFDAEGKIIETHLDYPEAMHWVAEREKVSLIDLHAMSAMFYEALGPEDSKKAFVHYPAGAYPSIVNDTQDNTHFNPYGAFELAKCVVAALKVSGLPLSKHIANFSGFNPMEPDDPQDFRWIDSPYRELAPQVLEKDDKAGEVPARK